MARTPSKNAAIRRRLNFKQYVVAVDADLIRLHRQDRGQRQRVAGDHVEGRTVARTDDAVPFQRSLVELAAIEGAAAKDGTAKTGTGESGADEPATGRPATTTWPASRHVVTQPSRGRDDQVLAG